MQVGRPLFSILVKINVYKIEYFYFERIIVFLLLFVSEDIVNEKKGITTPFRKKMKRKRVYRYTHSNP